MPKGAQWASAVADKLLGQQDFSVPTGFWVALYTDAPNENGGGTEVQDNAYERVWVENTIDMWPPADSGNKGNASPIVFPAPTGPWGTIVAFGLHLSETGDDLYLWGALEVPEYIDEGDEPKFQEGALSLEEV